MDYGIWSSNTTVKETWHEVPVMTITKKKKTSVMNDDSVSECEIGLTKKSHDLHKN
jgi:hypothetical protein